MDTILIAVTGLSLTMAAVMAIVLVRTLREERRRSDARVALLEQLAATQHRARGETSRGSASFNTAPPSTQDSTAPRHPDLELRPRVHDPVLTQEMFHEHAAPAAWPRRFAVVGAMAAVAAAAFIAWTTTRPVAPPPVQPAPAVRQVEQPLELLELRHAQQPGELVITGLVQNPRDAVALSGVEATVQLIGPGGEAVTGGRAPLDFSMLPPGEESPFVIRVPVSSAVARYRIGFRGDDDRVLGHVDRRHAEDVARKEAP